MQSLKQRYGQFEVEINNLVNAVANGLSSQSDIDRIRETDKAKHCLAAEIVMAETSRPMYPSIEELMDRLAIYREVLQTRNPTLCRPFVKLFVEGATVKPAGEVDFRYTFSPVMNGQESEYIQMVRTKGLEPLRSPTGT